jgi:hypothetical protein
MNCSNSSRELDHENFWLAIRKNVPRTITFLCRFLKTFITENNTKSMTRFPVFIRALGTVKIWT